MNDLNEFKARNEERERLLENLREQIKQDEVRLQELDKSISDIRRDINVLKQTIANLRGLMP